MYNGPNPGIYTSWNIAEQAIKGFSAVKHKKFKTFEEAKVSANLYTTIEFKAPLELINSAEGLKPTFAKALTKEKSSKISLGTIPKNQQKKLLEDNTDDVIPRILDLIICIKKEEERMNNLS